MRNVLAFAVVVVSVLVFGVANAAAALETADCNSEPATALPDAVSTAGAGGKVIVKGTCYVNLTVSDDVTLIGKRGATLKPFSTGGMSDQIVRVDAGAHLTLIGITVTGGDHTGVGGGIYVLEGSAATLKFSRVTRNETTSLGGGIFVEGGTLRVLYSQITRNTERNSGGI
jgi:hypothetical protein